FLRAKLGGSPVAGLSLAAELSVRLPPPAFSGQPFYRGISPAGAVLFTYDLRRVGMPLAFHFNSTFTFDNSVDFDDTTDDVSRRFALGITTYNRLTTAAALEGRFDVKGFGVRPFVEYELDVALGASGPIPMRIVPGLRLLPW